MRLAPVFAAIGLFAAPVHAASVTYALTQSNVLADGVHWATVSLETVGADVQFTVTTVPQAVYSAGPNFGLQSFAFNSALDLTSANLLLPSDWSLSTGRTVSGFGRFEYLLSATGSSRQDPLVFSITGVDGDLPETYFELSTRTAAQGNVPFAAHLAGFVSGACVNETTGATMACSSGYIGGGVPMLPSMDSSSVAAVPLPASIWLLISALLGIVGIGRRRRA